MKAYHFMEAPLLTTPPKAVLPDPNQNPGWYGELWLKYPLHSTLYSMEHPHVFKVNADLAVLLSEIALKLWGNSNEHPKTSNNEDLTSFAAKLTTWYRFLPEQLAPMNIIFPMHFRVQYALVCVA
jgi:hypothetical protein